MSYLPKKEKNTMKLGYGFNLAWISLIVVFTPLVIFAGYVAITGFLDTLNTFESARTLVTILTVVMTVIFVPWIIGMCIDYYQSKATEIKETYKEIKTRDCRPAIAKGVKIVSTTIVLMWILKIIESYLSNQKGSKK